MPAKYVIMQKGYNLHGRKWLVRGTVLGCDWSLFNTLVYEEEVAKPYELVPGKRVKMKNNWEPKTKEND